MHGPNRIFVGSALARVDAQASSSAARVFMGLSPFFEKRKGSGAATAGQIY
jgi:hypothetical protein